MTDFYFSWGSTLAGLTNIEAQISVVPTVLPANRIQLMGPNTKRTLDGAVHRSGSINAAILFDQMKLSDLDTLITTVWGDYTTPSVSYFISWLEERARQGVNHYSPFSCTLERPVEGVHFEIFNGTWAQNLQIPAWNCALQSNTENSTTTITTSERYNLSDTTSGAVTLTLPAANAVNANTVFSFTKSGGANALTVARAGADTIDGTTSITVTSRTNIVSNGTSAWTSI